jgi:hypothetical protein
MAQTPRRVSAKDSMCPGGEKRGIGRGGECWGGTRRGTRSSWMELALGLKRSMA